MVSCHICGGCGILIGRGCPGFVFIEVECGACKGSGELPDESVEWVKTGEAMRQDRQARGLNLAKEADRRGMKIITLSDMEAGCIEPVKE